ncbi:hypothetical protein EVAR_11965_1 [Eumeta japonica]|uniref:Uncharacterized protein n=1 Tax=Eumeta variegata TaxID=151549 RepID=A0A4C1U6A2_EUMVA|nr:hypothetical protein EVAR_11965_1 [Eumeta japonica]
MVTGSGRVMCTLNPPFHITQHPPVPVTPVTELLSTISVHAGSQCWRQVDEPRRTPAFGARAGVVHKGPDHKATSLRLSHWSTRAAPHPHPRRRPLVSQFTVAVVCAQVCAGACFGSCPSSRLRVLS